MNYLTKEWYLAKRKSDQITRTHQFSRTKSLEILTMDGIFNYKGGEADLLDGLCEHPVTALYKKSGDILIYIDFAPKLLFKNALILKQEDEIKNYDLQKEISEATFIIDTELNYSYPNYEFHFLLENEYPDRNKNMWYLTISGKQIYFL